MTNHKRETTKGNAMSTELRIADEHACNLAAELVELTGESLQWAVVTALRAQVDRELARKAKQDRIMAITREVAMSLRDPAPALAE
jgi:hypothetical protein